MRFVITHEAEDGTLSIIGTATGQPFRTDAAAERAVDKLIAEGDYDEGLDGFRVLPIESGWLS